MTVGNENVVLHAKRDIGAGATVASMEMRGESLGIIKNQENWQGSPNQYLTIA